MTSEELLSEVKTKIEFKEQEKVKQGGEINIFSILKKERSEVETHSNMIFALLNSKSGHSMGDIYLKLFLKEIGVDNKLINEKWTVEREWAFENGRIDFLLSCEKFCIPIEMKIDAGDQPDQLIRYERFAKNDFKDNYCIYYLTLYGKLPSEQSGKGVNNLKLISFKNNILQWLDECLANTKPDMQAYSLIKQYRDLVKKIVREGNMMKDLKKLITNSKSLKSAIEISNALDLIKTDVLMEFMNTLKDEFESLECEPNFYDEEITQNYYIGKEKIYPSMCFNLMDIDDSIKFCLSINLDWNLYCSVGFIEVVQKDGKIEWETVPIDKIKTDYKEKCEKCLKASESIFNNLTPSKDGLHWFYLTDKSSNNKFDFKHFSENCVALKDDCFEESRTICNDISDKIKSIKKELNRN